LVVISDRGWTGRLELLDSLLLVVRTKALDSWVRILSRKVTRTPKSGGKRSRT